MMSGVFAGGIVGYLPANKEAYLIENCENNGTVLLDSLEVITAEGVFTDGVFGCAGGIIGGAQDVVRINNCRNNGQLSVADTIQCNVLTDAIVAYVFSGSEPIFGAFN